MTETTSSPSFSSSEQPRRGLVQILTGDGRGKTTGALGVVLRALGHGLKVCIVVFMKGDYPYSEWKFLAKEPDVKLARFGSRAFIDPAKVKPEDIEQAKQALEFAREAVLSGDYDLVVLDEINLAAAWKLVELDEVIKLIGDKPPDVELILTGRQADSRLIELADLATECLNIKHPYEKGILARQGIDY